MFLSLCISIICTRLSNWRRTTNGNIRQGCDEILNCQRLNGWPFNCCTLNYFSFCKNVFLAIWRKKILKIFENYLSWRQVSFISDMNKKCKLHILFKNSSKIRANLWIYLLNIGSVYLFKLKSILVQVKSILMHDEQNWRTSVRSTGLIYMWFITGLCLSRRTWHSFREEVPMVKRVCQACKTYTKRQARIKNARPARCRRRQWCDQSSCTWHRWFLVCVGWINDEETRKLLIQNN